MALWGTIINAADHHCRRLAGTDAESLESGHPQHGDAGDRTGSGSTGFVDDAEVDEFLLIVASLVLGGLLGELLRVERNLEALGRQLERMVNALSRFIRRRSRGGKHSELADLQSEAQVQGRIAAGFVNTTLIYCVGAMAILGSLDSGLRGQHDILYVKAMMDGFLTVIFASTMGVGVLFSAFSVFLYQGAIALAASGIASLVDRAALDEIIMQITAVGGVLIMGIGINLLELRKINVANLLPSVLVAALAVPFVHWISTW